MNAVEDEVRLRPDRVRRQCGRRLTELGNRVADD